jgi:glutamine synthetase
LAQSLQEAIANLRRDQVLLEALGERLAGSYMAVKEADIAAFAEHDEAFELRQHAYKF